MKNKTNFLLSQLSNKQDFEMSCTDETNGDGYRISVRFQSDFDPRPFANTGYKKLSKAIRNRWPISIGQMCYRFEASIADSLIQAINENSRIDAICITLQSRLSIITFVGRDPEGLAQMVEELLPEKFSWLEETLTTENREQGRKVGHAAKDNKQLSDASISLDALKGLEKLGEAAAHQAITKEIVVAEPDLQDMRSRGYSPMAAFGIIASWRMLSRRPQPHRVNRQAFVAKVPELFRKLSAVKEMYDLVEVFTQLKQMFGPQPEQIIGNRLNKFAKRLCSPKVELEIDDEAIRNLLTIREWNNRSEKLAWDKLREWYEPSPKGPDIEEKIDNGSEVEEQIERPAYPIENLERSGSGLPDIPPNDRIASEFGLAGLELGNWVSDQRADRMLKLLSGSLADLRAILGDWIIKALRMANLSIAIGARGKGKGCAHYEPGLQVINLTRDKGDGTLAHELGHAIDHLLGRLFGPTKSGLLSRVDLLKTARTDSFHEALFRLMQQLQCGRNQVFVTGNPHRLRVFNDKKLSEMGYRYDLPPQEAFDRIADDKPYDFRVGQSAQRNSLKLVHTIARKRNEPVKIQLDCEGDSTFYASAKQLGKYWASRPELFARAFEAFIEDSLSELGWANRYLVFGTQLDYSRFRSNPYPAGTERPEINSAMSEFLDRVQEEIERH